MTNRSNKTEWEKKNRSEKLAAVLWPGLESDEVREEMAQLLRNEGRRVPFATPSNHRGKAK